MMIASALVLLTLTALLCRAISAYRRRLRELRIERAERARVSEEYQLLTQNIAAAILARDAQGKITYCSPFTEVLTGYPLSEILSSPIDFFLTIVHEEDREIYARALRVSEFGEPFQFRYRFYHKSGILMWVETRTVPVLAEDGALHSSLSITLDVTASVLYQRQVEEKNRDLQDFTYMVSHDLKAPIFTIKGMVGIIREEEQPSPQEALREPIDHIAQAALRLENLVGGVLEYARVANQDFGGDVQKIDCEELLREYLEENALLLRETGAQIDVQSPLPEVLADRTSVYQIFANLIGNAVKYRAADRAPNITVSSSSERTGRFVTFEIRDNGLGIPADKIEGIFRPFQRAHTLQEGSGIGLACVKKLAEKLGGQVAAQSTLGAGSVFSVTLRRAAPLGSELSSEVGRQKEEYGQRAG